VVPFDLAPYGTTIQICMYTHINKTGNITTPSPSPRISEWNTALPQYTNNFSSFHPDVYVSIYDVHTLYTTILANPQEYGFVNDSAICDSIECIWSSDVHSTFAMHDIIAADMARFLGNSNAVIPNGSSASSSSSSTSSTRAASTSTSGAKAKSTSTSTESGNVGIISGTPKSGSGRVSFCGFLVILTGFSIGILSCF
jgi:phospholipase/lecithinase/hemolysin